MQNQRLNSDCRFCPSGNFKLVYVCKSRFIAICNAINVIIQPQFPNEKIRESQHISRANVQTAMFSAADNCPHIERQRKEGIIPWATSTIDFLTK